MNQPNKLKSFLKKENIKAVDMKFVDIQGNLRHITFHPEKLDKVIKNGIGFDGSSLSNFVPVKQSDLVLQPDFSYFFIEPFFEIPTVSFFADIYKPDGKPLDSCPRNILKKVCELFKKEKIADTILILPEFEFYIFDKVHFHVEKSNVRIKIESIESKEKIQGNAYHITPPYDRWYNFRTELTEMLNKMNIPIKYHHHEVGSYAQEEIETEFLELPFVADAMMLIRYVIKNLAEKKGVAATFMPKPLPDEPGNGLHLHIILKKKKRNLFAKRGKEISEIGRHFIGGIMKYGKPLCALTNPSVNSYKRLSGTYETPKKFNYAEADRTAAIRIPGYVKEEQDIRLEYRVPDSTSNPYILITGILLAGKEGIEKNIEPHSEESIPSNLIEALDELKNNNQFLLKDKIFTKEFLETWIKMKEEEYKTITSYPHPLEFKYYF